MVEDLNSSERRPISQIIKERLDSSERRYFANDNISSYIEDGELELLQEELAEKFQGVLTSLIIDVENDPNSRGTAARLAKMYLRETLRGRYTPEPPVTAFPNEKNPNSDIPDSDRPFFSYSGLLVVPAEIDSMCSHHHAPTKGMAYIGIIPGERVIGLSKYVRLAQHLARRGTLQEQLTRDILVAIKEATGTSDVAVFLVETHGCMTCRGVEASKAFTSSVELSGSFYSEPELRSEFYKNVEMLEKRHGAG